MTAKPMTKKAHIYELRLAGKSIAEIAAAVGVTTNHVRSSLTGTRRMLAADWKPA